MTALITVPKTRRERRKTAAQPLSAKQASCDPDNGWLLTGATGLVGRFVLRELLLQGRDVCVLVRGRGAFTAQQRVESIVQFWENDTQQHLIRPYVVDANLLKAGLNVDPQVHKKLAKRFRNVLHCAASVRFEMDAAGVEPLATNIDGTKNLIEFAESIGCDHFHHISTAYVCGDVSEVAKEQAANLHAPFRNPYEYSKAAGEKLVQNAECFATKTIYRPSIVIGRHQDGWANAFHTLYAAVRFARELYAAGVLDFENLTITDVINGLGLDGSELKNVVPVDWVAAAISKITSQPKAWDKIYHLTHPEPSTVNDIANSILNAIRRNIEKWQNIPTVIAPEDVDESAFTVHLEAYAEYFRNDPLFHRAHTIAVDGLDSPPAMNTEALTTAFDFAISEKFRDTTGLAQPQPIASVSQFVERLNHWHAIELDIAAAKSSSKLFQLTLAGCEGGTWYCEADGLPLQRLHMPTWLLGELLDGNVDLHTAVDEQLIVGIMADGVADAAAICSVATQLFLELAPDSEFAGRHGSQLQSEDDKDHVREAVPCEVTDA